MSSEHTYRDLIKALKLAQALEAGIGWYDVSEEKKELAELYEKYKVES